MLPAPPTGQRDATRDRASMSQTRGPGDPSGAVLHPRCGHRNKCSAAAGRTRHRPVHHAALAAEGRRRLAALRRAPLDGRPRTLRRRGGDQSAADRVDLRHPDLARRRCWRIDAQFTAIPFFVAAVLACAWWTASLLRGSGKLFEDRLPVFAAIGTVLLVVPAGDLGQREHLLVAAILPYLALFARSLDGERAAAARRPDRRRARRSRLRAEASLRRCVRRARGSRGCCAA